MLLWIFTGLVLAGFDDFNYTDYDPPANIGDYGGATDITLINCTYECNKYLYFQCYQTEQGRAQAKALLSKALT